MHHQSAINKTVLYLSDLPDNINDSEIENFFSNYKNFIVLIQTDRSRPYQTPKCIVIFKDHFKAEEAKQTLNMLKLRGKTINIMWHEKDNSARYNTVSNLFVKGLSQRVNPREVYLKFLQYGDIMSIKLCEDQDCNLLGYGYINYYSKDAANSAINELNGKEVWGNTLEVSFFQKKNERIISQQSNKRELYIKNMPLNYKESNLKKMFSEYGTVSNSKIFINDITHQPYGIIAFENNNEEFLNKVIEEMNGKVISPDTAGLYVSFFQNKQERQKMLSMKINENNSVLNTKFKDCNLIIKNLPLDVPEEQLGDIFKQYGEIKSVKIQKYLLVTKENGKFVEIPSSKGFGYVCFADNASAVKAINELNNKVLPGYDNSRRPIIVSFFMPKNERKEIITQVQNNLTHFNNAYLSNNYAFQGQLLRRQNYDYKNMHMQPRRQGQQAQGHYHRQQINENEAQNQISHPIQNTQKNSPDINFLNSLDNVEAKKDYIGEFLFKNIENHPEIQKRNATIDIIGKITGMILGIDDINEIIDISSNQNNLAHRIKEALSLIESQ